MSIYWNETTSNIIPYVPGEQPQDKKYIKLNTNENPYPPSPKVIEAIKLAANESLRLYPDPECKMLKEAIAEVYNISIENVFAGNGSDEILAFCFMAFFDEQRPVKFADITYSFYNVYADFFKVPYEIVPLNQDFSLPVEKFITSEEPFRQAGIIIANPNAPTGMAVDINDIEKIVCANQNNVVIIDEAYVDFGCESAVPFTKKYPNLLVVHTLSKSRSLAGLRAGFAIGSAELMEGLQRVKNSFNSYTLDRIAISAATAAFKDKEYFEETRKKIMLTRERFSQHLMQLGFKVIPSNANFVFASHELFKAEFLFKELKERGILVRYFKKPGIDNYLRITIGTDEEMDTLIETLKIIINKQL